MSVPSAVKLLWLTVCVESASIPVESGGISPDIGKKELLNAKKLLRQEIAEETDSKRTRTRKEADSLAETISKGNAEPVAEDLRAYSDWQGWNLRETGSLPPPSTHVYPSGSDPWMPKPPHYHKIPYEKEPVGYWSFEHDTNLQHGAYASDRWHAPSHSGGPPHFGVSGHWDLSGGHKQPEADEGEPLSLKERVMLKAKDRRNPEVPKFDQDWPPADGSGSGHAGGPKYGGHWRWHGQNDYKHPDWVRPEEVMSGGGEFGPGRWAWSWQHQNEIWKPMPAEEYAKWTDHIRRVSADHNIYEMSDDPICASCAGGCALPGRCEFQGQDGLDLKRYCVMKEGKLCAESHPGVKPPEPEYSPPPQFPPFNAPEAKLDSGYWDDTTWVEGARGGGHAHAGH